MKYRLESTLLHKVENGVKVYIPAAEFDYKPVLGHEYDDFDSAMRARHEMCKSLNNGYVRVVKIENEYGV
jgi:hypothetical protein